jgi:hypothetical protein
MAGDIFMEPNKESLIEISQKIDEIPTIICREGPRGLVEKEG